MITMFELNSSLQSLGLSEWAVSHAGKIAASEITLLSSLEQVGYIYKI